MVLEKHQIDFTIHNENLIFALRCRAVGTGVGVWGFGDVFPNPFKFECFNCPKTSKITLENVETF